MPAGAPRLMMRARPRCVRGVWPLLYLWLALLVPGSPAGADITGAHFADPTTRYDHAVLGDGTEWGALVLHRRGAPGLTLTLPHTRVFEDTAPRLADLDGDGTPEVIVVETSLAKGARLAIYGEAGLITATPYIGRTHRWLAPIGAADLDGDGQIEIAYIDRPHLAKRLRIWRYQNRALTHVADRSGLTNHRIGWDHIPGGIRDCDAAPLIITANADWTRIIAARLLDGAVITQDIAPYTGPHSLNAALTCD